jgi:hypothetical protein
MLKLEGGGKKSDSKIIVLVDEAVEVVLDGPDGGKGEGRLEDVEGDALVEALESSLAAVDVGHQLPVVAEVGQLLLLE